MHTASATSLTVDEPHYIGTGLYLWASGDYDAARSLRFHPPLTYHLAALPLLALDLRHVETGPALGDRLIRGSEPPPDLVKLLSRLPFIGLTCWGAVLLFLWASEAASMTAGLLALFLYSFSPTILANGGLVHSDITVTVLYVQTLYAFWRWWQRPSPARYLLSGLSLGLALIAKLNALLLLPTLGLMTLGIAFDLVPAVEASPRAFDRRPVYRMGWATAVVLGWLGIAIVVIWCGYGGSFAASEVDAAWSGGGYRLPAYLHSLTFDVTVNAMGRPVFLAGEYSTEGWWYFLPFAFLVKTPLPVLLLLVVAICSRHRIRASLGPLLAVSVAVYALIACFWLRVPLGLRYVLPLVPLLHLYVGVRVAPTTVAWRRAVTVVCALWLLVESAWIHPHYLAYFNQLVGGPRNAYRYLVDSNLDWGQSLPALARYLENRGNPTVKLAYFGPEAPARYGIRAQPLEGCRPVSGLVAISATVLQRLYDPARPFGRPPEGCYDWLADRQPAAQPGYGILVYEVE